MEQNIRTGNVWTAAAHIITAVIGSGVLSLAWSVAQFGWATGPFLLLLFAGITYYASILLTDCYRSPDPLFGARHPTYAASVRSILGQRYQYFLGIAQYFLLVGGSLSYIITSGTSMASIQRDHCSQEGCTVRSGKYLVIFGAVQVIFSQIPNFNKVWWLSILATIMSFCYSFVALGLSINETVKHGVHGAAIGMEHTYDMLQALGNIAFAYCFSCILIEVQDTIKSPAGEGTIMKKAVAIGCSTSTTFYMAVACFGYAAFGASAPGNILTGFHKSPLKDFANVCIVMHLIGGYQVLSQPVFAVFENFVSDKLPEFVTKEWKVLPFVPLKFSILRLVWRSLYAALLTLVALLFPFFNSVIGLVGAVTFWPLTIYFPVEMYAVQFEIKRWTMKWWLLQGLSLLCLCISLAAAVGSVRGIVDSSKGYKAFQF